MQLVEIFQKNNHDYQSFVQSKGVFLQDFEWGNFQASLGKKVYRFVLADADAIHAAIQLIETDTGGFKYLFAPHGPVFKEPDPTLLNFLLYQLKQRFPSTLLIRIEPQQTGDFSGLALRPSINLNPHKTLVLDLTKTEEQLLAEMHPKTRYNIKIAQRDGVQTKIQQSAEGLLQPIFDAGERARIKSFSADYYKKLVERFSVPKKAIEAKVFTARHGQDLLATNIILFYQDTAIYLFGGSSNIKRNLMAPYLLHWQAIQKAKELGYKKYDFWGVEDDPTHPWAGISKFKFGFGGEQKKYAGTLDYVVRPTWYNVYKFIRALNRLLR